MWNLQLKKIHELIPGHIDSSRKIRIKLVLILLSGTCTVEHSKHPIPKVRCRRITRNDRTKEDQNPTGQILNYIVPCPISKAYGDMVRALKGLGLPAPKAFPFVTFLRRQCTLPVSQYLLVLIAA
jgi:hypothetical protein